MSVSFNNDIPGDVITNLPVDQSIPTHTEIQILDTLFKQKQGTIQRVFSGTKDVLIIGFLFILFSLPQIDELIKKFAPSAENSPYILMLVKTVLFMVAYFIIKNMYLVRK